MPFAPGDTLFADDLGRCGLVARRVAVQAFATGVAGGIAWDTEDFDSDNFLTPTSGIIVIPFAGVYTITAHVDNGASTGLVFQQFSMSSGLIGAPGLFRSYTPSGEPFGLLAGTARFLAGDSFQVVVQHSSGVSKNYTAALQCWRVSA